MLIIDRKGFRVMSILHRTYRVTRLRVIYLLNTRQGVWEKITEKVSDTEKFRTAESYRRERSSISFDDTEKLFWDTPLSQIGFGTCLIILGGCQNHSGIFLEFSEIKTGNVRSCRSHFRCVSQMKITKTGIFSEHVENYYGGYWKCSKPT